MPAQRPGVELPSEVRPFGILALLGLLVRAVLAYVAGFTLFIEAFALSRKFGSLLQDPALRNFALFIVIALMIAVLLLALLQPMWSGEVRGFALMTSFTLLAIALTQAIGLTHIDPTAPLADLVQEHLDALRVFRR
jgi:hypothetical protein